ncbi:thiamine pyrophosphate-dependent enzyme [Parapedobacter indicus]|uniref:Pyruvate dehydrogenase (Quinone) n=1 Tax=Parapedobacter indicus TaxID=1477437 RepID=A0A1I3VAM2_9SPHI|nr:thiamine pyrophosphate-dependent enzyme [Parapedobacter indicus]PPK98936.1 pyruvate dehydrogenase (quinone) [Parapedobacter indicus]SFJ92408.1 pyruvate dehydrogenase (quinone) [Parapedobacter indicus]
MSKKIAEQLVDMLVENGIKRIYAVTGDSLNELNDAVRRNGKIKWIHVRHEEAGAYAATAEAKLNGIACCAGSSGPGHVHLVNGLYDAHRSGASVIAIAATINTREFGTDYHQETNTIKLFDDCSCYNQVIQTPAQAPRMIQAAIQHAIHQRGVAVIGLPGDIAAEPAQESVTSMHNYSSVTLMRPIDEELQKAAALLNRCPKVSIFCGIGAVHAREEIIRLAKTLRAPVGYTFPAKPGIQPDNPYEVGMTGLLGLPSAYHAMHESDVVLLLGTDFPYTPFMPTKSKLIQIDDKPEKLGRRAKLELGLTGDVKDTLIALLPYITDKTDDSFLRAQLTLYGHVKKHLNTYVEDPGTPDHIQPEFAAHTINKLVSDEAVFTMDTGMCCVWAARYIDGARGRRFLGSFNHGSMANAMPMAIGAALAQPEKEIIALCGDGGLTMLLGDLVTIKQYNLPIKIIVFNNRSLGMVKLEMEVQGLVDNETNLVNPDFALIGTAMGFKSVTINSHQSLYDDLSEALEHNGPVIIDIKTNPHALAMPPKVEWEQLKGFTLSVGKMMLSGRMDEAMQTLKSNYKHLKEII